MKTTYFSLGIMASMTFAGHAALTWSGGGNGVSLYQETNWLDDDGLVPGPGTIDGGSDVTANTGAEKLIEISGGTGTPNNYSPGFQIGAGNNLTVANGKTLGGTSLTGGGTNSTLTLNNTANLFTGGITQFSQILVNNSTIDLNGTNGISTAAGASTINIANGGSVDAQFISNNFTLSVDGTSSLTLNGGGDPINGGTVHLSIGAQLTLATVAEFTEQGNDIFVDGVSYNSDNSILSFSGTTATAIPEPSSTALLSLGGLALILRRRK